MVGRPSGSTMVPVARVSCWETRSVPLMVAPQVACVFVEMMGPNRSLTTRSVAPRSSLKLTLTVSVAPASAGFTV